MEKTFYIAIANEDQYYESPDSETLKDLMFNPNKLGFIPNDEIKIYCRTPPGIKKDDPRYKSGAIGLYLDHKGMCMLRYSGRNVSGHFDLINTDSNSKNLVEFPSRFGGSEVFYERSWVPVNEGLKYVEGFCSTGEISINTKRWEKV